MHALRRHRLYRLPGLVPGISTFDPIMRSRKLHKDVRPLVDRDIEGYQEIRMRSIKESPQFACPGIVRDLTLYARGRHNLLSMHSLEGGRVWGAYAGTSLAGVAAVSRYVMRDGVELNLWGLYVIRKHRGSCVALSLFRTALQWCRSQPGIDAVRIHVRRDERRVSRWCQRNGFARVDDPTLASTKLQTLRLDLRSDRGHSLCGHSSADSTLGDNAA